MITRKEFEQLLGDYARDELAPVDHAKMDAYLAQHPAERREVEQTKTVTDAAHQIRRTEPPADLLREARGELTAQLVNRPRPVSLFRRARSKPAYLTGLAAALALVLIGELWWGSSSDALAAALKNLEQVRSFRVSGWIRGANGDRVPFQQHLASPNLLRAEIGAGPQRSIVVSDGQSRRIQIGDRYYHQPVPAHQHIDFRWVARSLYGYDNEYTRTSASSFAQEEIDGLIRYTITSRPLGGQYLPGIKYQIDIDPTINLPRATTVYQQVDSQWIQLSHLRYDAYDAAIPQDLFALYTGLDTAIDSLTQETKQALWFELSISPSSALCPAFYVPPGDISVQPLAAGQRPVGMISGDHTNAHGGVRQHFFIEKPLRDIVQTITGLYVADGEWGRQPLSLEVSFKEALPWPERVAPLLDSLGLAVETTERTSARNRFVFVHDGRPLPLSRHQESLSEYGVNSLGHHFRFQRTSLEFIVDTLLRNALDNGLDRRIDRIEFIWQGEAAANPFKGEVDFRLESSGQWTEHLQALQDHFGVSLEIRPEEIRHPVLVLGPAAP
ncbi:MAG: hypothetical protein GKR89_34930 [Candidatus Latescibacteria bacterium]|nr:hypothetical protein [Candidatus Latescibacterota bacterium]